MKGNETEAGMLSGISRKRSIRSNPYWFTEFCNSQCLSHFAAPFIVVRTETSAAESFKANGVERTTREDNDDRYDDDDDDDEHVDLTCVDSKGTKPISSKIT